MIKTISFTLVCLLLFVAVVPAFAQDEADAALPACTDEELQATVDGTTAINDSFGETIANFDLTSDPTSTDYGTTLVALEALSASYWSEFFPQVPACAEAVAFAYTIGLHYDEYLTVGLLNNLAAWLATGGDAEGAQALADQGAARLENLQAIDDEMADMTFEEFAQEVFSNELPACTEEEMTAASDGLQSALEEIGAFAEQQDDPAVLFALTEGASYAFWDEAYDALATCAENEAVAFQIGLLLSDANIITGLYANAAAESAAGNEEVATAMADAAQAREQAYADMMPTEEPE